MIRSLRLFLVKKCNNDIAFQVDIIKYEPAVKVGSNLYERIAKRLRARCTLTRRAFASALAIMMCH